MEEVEEEVEAGERPSSSSSTSSSASLPEVCRAFTVPGGGGEAGEGPVGGGNDREGAAV